MLEEALIRRRRAEDLSHSVQLHLFIQQLSWTLHKPDGKPLVSVESSDISFSRTHHRDRSAPSPHSHCATIAIARDAA